MDAPTAPELRFTFRIVADTGPYLPLEQRATELLEFIPITGGTVEGDVSGTIIPGGGDWCLTRADDAYQVEARYLIRTDQDDIVDVVNLGIVRHLPGESGEEMGYFQSTPRFRTTSPRLQWLTRSVFVGRATSHATGTTIDVFEVLA
ncbi:DUF3237 family protein [Rhodococcoides fascians]|uniref:DUF3237 family protein n=1 Tax=Rhodococcoides fascians TaxID=1828 RepID=UPI000691C57B|nr:DUF3237 family protein [Rhodococcus fascians]